MKLLKASKMQDLLILSHNITLTSMSFWLFVKQNMLFKVTLDTFLLTFHRPPPPPTPHTPVTRYMYLVINQGRMLRTGQMKKRQLLKIRGKVMF